MESDQIDEIVKQVDPGLLRRNVERLAAYPRFNHDRHGETLGYLDKALNDYGLQVTGHTFSYRGRIGINLVGRKAGANQSLAPYLVCAHYDTVDGSVGADDNASGLAALLECARILSPLPLSRNIDFVALDMEEMQPEGEALVGSEVFVKERTPVKGYAGVFNLEMVGYTSGPGTQQLPPGFPLLFPQAYQHVSGRGFTGDSLAVVSRSGSIFLSDALSSAASRHLPNLDVVALQLPDDAPAPPDLFRSDHASFWAAGIPAVMLTDTANFRNPHYHTPQDTPDTLDYEFLRRVTSALAASLITLAAG